MLRQLGPRRPTAYFSLRGKERTQRSPACGPATSPSGRWPISASLEGPSQAHQTNSAPLEGSGSTLRRVTHLRLARGLPSDPRPRNRISASLEDSGPALERVASLRLARGQRTCPRAGGQSPPRSRPSLGTRDKRPRRPTDRRTKALKASHSTTAQRAGGVRLPLPQWM